MLSNAIRRYIFKGAVILFTFFALSLTQHIYQTGNKAVMTYELEKIKWGRQKYRMISKTFEKAAKKLKVNFRSLP